MDRSLAELPVVASAIGGAESALSGVGASVQLTQVPDLADPPKTLLRKRLDGVVLAGAMQGTLISETNSELLGLLRTLPTVWLLGRPIGCEGDAVGSDDHATGEQAAEYLFERGHRQLAFVNPKPDHLLFARREDGFAATARRLGAEVTTYAGSASDRWTLPLHRPETVETVQGLVDDLIAAKPHRTAVFAAADSVATLIYRALAVRGLRVGEDISVISGNNDAALIRCLHPRLTTFDIHAHELGRMAVRQLAMRISTSDEFPSTDLTIPPTLVEGDSVAPRCVSSRP
jgi:LacI family transcriptional regulator